MLGPATYKCGIPSYRGHKVSHRPEYGHDYLSQTTSSVLFNTFHTRLPGLGGKTFGSPHLGGLSVPLSGTEASPERREVTAEGTPEGAGSRRAMQLSSIVFKALSHWDKVRSCGILLECKGLHPRTIWVERPISGRMSLSSSLQG